MWGYASQCFELVDQVTMVIITEEFRQLLPLRIQIGFEIADHRAKSNQAGITFWMQPHLFKKMPFQCSFCCERRFLQFPERNISHIPFDQLDGVINIALWSFGAF